MTNILQKPSVLSVSQLSFSLKHMVENSFSSVKVQGEISGLKVHSSGHTYFSLKDDQSVLDGICWKGTSSSMPIKLQDGMDVICQGRVTTYPARSKYQIIVESVELAGIGPLMKMLQERKELLEKEGLFAASHKKPLPFLPKCIGVITSPTGAVIRDILHRLNDRFPCSVVVWPVVVQGPTAADEVSRAIEGFNRLENKPDIIIVARGGGSFEDLWPFNDESIVRAVFRSVIPVISAIGHETDTTLIDLVADRRAPTPTAAAEMAVPVRDELWEFVKRCHLNFSNGIFRLFREFKTKIDLLGRTLGNPKKIIEGKIQTLDDKGERLNVALNHALDRKKRLLMHAEQLLESYSYQKVLKRGFTLVKNEEGQIVGSASKVDKTAPFTVVFHDGIVEISPQTER